jgi:hypothetical protein
MEVKLEASGNGKQHRENRSAGSFNIQENRPAESFRKQVNRKLKRRGYGGQEKINVRSLRGCSFQKSFVYL